MTIKQFTKHELQHAEVLYTEQFGHLDAFQKNMADTDAMKPHVFALIKHIKKMKQSALVSPIELAKACEITLLLLEKKINIETYFEKANALPSSSNTAEEYKGLTILANFLWYLGLAVVITSLLVSAPLYITLSAVIGGVFLMSTGGVISPQRKIDALTKENHNKGLNDDSVLSTMRLFGKRYIHTVPKDETPEKPKSYT